MILTLGFKHFPLFLTKRKTARNYLVLLYKHKHRSNLKEFKTSNTHNRFAFINGEA